MYFFSYEHSYGHIRYSLKANYSVPWGFDKNETTRFYVTSKVDLNQLSYLREPVRQAKEKIFGCCCCESDPMQLINILPRGGFVPGESIPVSIEVDNNSDVRIDFVRVKLREDLGFFTRSPSSQKRSESVTINEHIFRTKVDPFQKKLFQVDFYLNPNREWKIFNGCGIITCEYFLKSEAEASGCHKNPDNTTKVIIGTIPFEDSSNVTEIPTAPMVFDATAPEDVAITEQPLPSYNDVVAPGPSDGIGWNVGAKGMSGALVDSKNESEKAYKDLRKCNS